MESQIAGCVRDSRGTPVAGAVVSDCLSARATGPDGRFRLPGRGPFVWVCPPVGWTCDRWWQRRADVPHDFVLHRVPSAANQRIAHIADLHLTHSIQADASSPLGESILHPLAGAVRNGRAGLIVATGDVTDRGTVTDLRSAVKELAAIGVPFRLVSGFHDHHGDGDDLRSTEVQVQDNKLETGSLRPWEEIVGPRWWSMNFGSLHLVALDWFGARSGPDHLAQTSWLAADLALVPPRCPVVLLSHEQPNSTFLQTLKRQAPHIRLVAVLTGNRHAPRAVKINGALHLCTGPGIVGGRDWSRPQMRLVEWDGDEVVSHTVVPTGSAPPRFRSSPPRWAFQTRVAPGASSLHLAGHPDGVVATTADHDRAKGSLALLDGQTGKVRWSWDSPQPIASAAAVDPEGSVFVQTVGGMALRVEDGRPAWIIEAADPAATWVTSTPVPTGEGGLITAGLGFVRCLGCTDGRVRWTRYLDATDRYHPQPSGRVCDGLAVMPLAGHAGLTVLNPRDGAILWSDPAGTANPRSSPAPLGDGTALIVRGGACVERFELSTGRVRWSTALDGPASGAAPVVIDELALVVTADAVVHILDSKTGWLLRDHRLATRAESSGNKAGGSQLASAAAVVGDFLHVITVAGEWWQLDPFHWEPVLVATLPLAVSEQPVEVGLNLVVPGREGVVLAARLQTEANGSHPIRRGRQVDDDRSPRLKAKSNRWLRTLKLLRA